LGHEEAIKKSYSKTTSDLRKTAIDSLELLFINTAIFYYLIYQGIKFEGKGWGNLKKALKYSFPDRSPSET
jgi:hypothetical protein